MPDTVKTDPLQAAFAELVDALQQAETDIRASPSFGTESEQLGGYRHLLRSFAKGMEAEVIQDVDFPYFRILDFWLREGGDNPDQRYAFSPIRGGKTYRVSIDGDCHTFAYRKNYFGEDGIGGAEVPRT